MVRACGYRLTMTSTTLANSGPDRSGVGKVKCRPDFGSTAQKTFAVPHRLYSLSRLAIPPGLAGTGYRTSSCRLTGFSSRQTTGSEASKGFSYVARTSSILETYSSSSSGRHHIFSPPRLQIVALEQDANRLTADAGASFRLTASWAMRRTVHRAWPSGGSLQTMIIRCLSAGCRTGDAPGRCLS